MANDFDFRVGRRHLKGHGSRGLIALGLWLFVRGAVIVIVVIASKPSIAYIITTWR